MAADCYCCMTGVTKLPTNIGKTNVPVGSCTICQSFACGKHGQRDPGPPRFVCALCIPSLLISSSANLIKESGQLKEYLDSLIKNYPTETLFKSIDDFLRRHPEFKPWIENFENIAINYDALDEFDSFRQAFEYAESESQLMLIAAGEILLKLYPAELPEGYPAYMIFLHNSINNNLNFDV